MEEKQVTSTVSWKTKADIGGGKGGGKGSNCFLIKN